MPQLAPQELVYRVRDHRYVGTLIPPVGDARAFVVLLPDWRGRSDLALAHAQHLSAAGCVVLVADLYGDGLNPTNPDQVGPMVQHLLTHREEGVEALSAAIEAGRAASGAGLPLLTVGFSAGAVAALDHARRTREVAAVAVCSGLLRTAEPGTPSTIAAPVLLVQGTQDEVSPMSVIAEVVAEADAAGNDVRLLLLSQTHHAYDNPDAGTDTTARLVYSERSAVRMREALTALIHEVADSRQPDHNNSAAMDVGVP